MGTVTWEKGKKMETIKINPIETKYVDAQGNELVAVVRCKDCIHYWKNYPTEVAVCLASPRDDAYCSEGERRKDAEEE